MGYIFHSLTAVLVVLKALGYTALSWLQVFVPSIAVIAINTVILLMLLLAICLEANVNLKK